MEDILDLVNSDPYIRPYMESYPFTSNNISLSLSFFDSICDEMPAPNMAFVFNAKNKVYYDINDMSTSKFKTVHEETYQEALDIVRAQENAVN